MKRIFTPIAVIMLAIIMLAGCGSAGTISVTTLPTAAAPPSAEQSVMPALPSSTFVLPSPKINTAPAVKPSPTPSPEEKIVIHKKNIPDIIEGDGRNLDSDIYEDDKYLYFYENVNSYFEFAYVPGIKDVNYPSVCRITKTTGKYVRLLKYCSEFCVEGDNIYWVESKKSKSNIKRYDIKTKKNTIICSAENFIGDIQSGIGRLYYTMQRNAKVESVYDLYSVDINGLNNKKLIDNIQPYFIKYKDYIIYTPGGNNEKQSIYVYNVVNKKITELDGKCKYSYCTAYGKIYFYDDNEACVISIDIASGEKKIFRDVNDSYPMVLGQYLFYYNTRKADGSLRLITDNEPRYGDIAEFRAYDMINGEYYYIPSKDLWYPRASNKKLYFFYEASTFSKFLKSLTIHNGKASVKKVMEYESGDC